MCSWSVKSHITGYVCPLNCVCYVCLDVCVCFFFLIKFDEFLFLILQNVQTNCAAIRQWIERIPRQSRHVLFYYICINLFRTFKQLVMLNCSHIVLMLIFSNTLIYYTRNIYLNSWKIIIISIKYWQHMIELVDDLHIILV